MNVDDMGPCLRAFLRGFCRNDKAMIWILVQVLEGGRSNSEIARSARASGIRVSHESVRRWRASLRRELRRAAAEEARLGVQMEAWWRRPEVP